MAAEKPHSKPPPKHVHRASPAERAWLDRINRQLAYDEYMQAQRELWLVERPSRRGTGQASARPARPTAPQAQSTSLS